MNDLKLCKNCEHQRYGSYYVEARGFAIGFYCVANIKIKTSVSLVTGREETYSSGWPVGCEQARSCWSECGEDAKNFVLRVPIPPSESLWCCVKRWFS